MVNTKVNFFKKVEMLDGGVEKTLVIVNFYFIFKYSLVSFANQEPLSHTSQVNLICYMIIIGKVKLRLKHDLLVGRFV